MQTENNQLNLNLFHKRIIDMRTLKSFDLLHLMTYFTTIQ
jgi:hypothetical protein